MLACGVMSALAFFRVGFAIRFLRKVMLVAYIYIGFILFLALIQFVFHVRL